ncbi:hypothetical protein [Spirillospora sp. NPDC047279]|uniref:hypothetical protein n=1 Tax=Spirillospora sp. NPDC047279 TaxID=3155478 RepID=UPI0033C86050
MIVVLSSAACSGDDGGGRPPAATPVVRESLPALAPAQDLAARTVVYRFLRGIAGGDAKVCSLLAPVYQRSVFGTPTGCRTGFGAARQRLRPKDVAALRKVVVPKGKPGPGADEYTVRFEDLRWKGEPARPGGVLAARFTLRRTGSGWVISG